MNLAEIKAQISGVVDSENCSAEFYFLLGAGAGATIKRADVDQAAAAELAQNFIEQLRTTVLGNDELSLLNISSADERANVLYKYDLADIPAQIQSLSTVMEHDAFAQFDFSEDDLSELQGILILLGHGDQQLVLYKHHYPVQLLRRDGFSLVKLRNQNRLVKLEDDILRINSKFEFFYLGGEYFISDMKTLERFFGFHEAVRNVARAGIVTIQQAGIIVDAQVLVDRLSDVSFSRKLVRAATGSPVLGVIPNEQVIAFVSTHPALQGKFRLSHDGSMLQLDTKVSQNLFLQLLSDDFLQSELTNLYYASLAKDAVEPPAATP